MGILDESGWIDELPKLNIAMVRNTIRDLEIENKRLKARIAELEAKITELGAKIVELELKNTISTDSG